MSDVIDVDGETVNDYLAHLLDASVIELEPREYVLPYGLALGCRRASRLHPALPPFALDDVTLDGNGATIIIPPWDSDDPRTRYGVPALQALWAKNVTVENLNVRGGRFGLIANGCDRLTLRNCHFTEQRLDFVYLQSGAMDLETGDRDVNTNITIEDCTFRKAGRQGFVLNGVDGFAMSGCEVRGVARMVFDVEPTRSGQATDLCVHDNRLPPGGLGFVNYTGKPASAPIGDWHFWNNQIAGHMRVNIRPTVSEAGELVRHRGFAFHDNTNTSPDHAYSNRENALIRVFGWDDVQIQANHDYVTSTAKILALGGCDGVVCEPNDWQVTEAT